MAKVMLVEDDNNLREIYEARLLAEGYEIISAHDGEEALALAVREKPDLIISDVMMPKISGFDMLDILRGSPETKNTKVIMMTALSQIEDKDRADKLGADRYLVKSQVTLEDVVRVAREVLEGTASPGLPEPTQLSSAAPVAAPAAIAVTPAPEPVVPAPAADNTTGDPGTAASTDDDAPAAAPDPEPAAAPPQTPVSEPAAEPAAEAPAAPGALTAEPEPAEAPAEPAAEPTAEIAQPAEPSSQDAALEAAEKELEQAQTSEAEQHTVEQQIDDFEKSDVTPPAITVDENGNISTAPSDAQQPDDRPKDLKLPEPETAEEPKQEPVSAPEIAVPAEAEAATAEPAAEADTEPPSQDAAVGGNRVIQPLNDPSAKPDLNALLEKEEEKEKMAQILNAAGVAPAASAVPDATQAPAADNAEPKPDDPNSIAL